MNQQELRLKWYEQAIAGTWYLFHKVRPVKQCIESFAECGGTPLPESRMDYYKSNVHNFFKEIRVRKELRRLQKEYLKTTYGI